MYHALRARIIDDQLILSSVLTISHTWADAKDLSSLSTVTVLGSAFIYLPLGWMAALLENGFLNWR